MSSKHERGADDSDGRNAAKSPKVVKSDKTTAASSSASATTTTSLANFMQLPHELRLSVLELACYKPPQQDQGGNISKTWRLQLDTQMLCNLILVSREFQSTFQPLLYAHVKLGRPSTLASFHASLVSRPSNATHVKSIWLGPLSGLGDKWWPVEVKYVGGADYGFPWMDDDDEDEVAALKTSLRRRDGPLNQLPRWAKPESEWTHDQDVETCQEKAVAMVLSAAIESVNVYFSTYLYDEDIEDLGINEWTIRLFEVQAVLDLYLCALRRVDDATGRDVPSWRSKSRARKSPEQCRVGKCGHYPKLKLIGFDEPRDKVNCGNQQGNGPSGRGKDLAEAPASTRHEAEDGAGEARAGKQDHLADCIITREQAKEHISRRGAITDHYEHPIVYARSKSRKLAVDDDGKVFVDYNEERTQAEHYWQEFEMDSDSESCDLHRDSDDSNSDDAETRKRPSKAKATMPQPLDHTTHNGILALARTVLGRTTRLTTLALTGSFRVLLDEELPVLRTLRFLSLGPLSPLTDTSHCLSNAMLPALEQLRICGGVIGMAAVRKMAGQDKDKSLPRLKKIVWDFGSSTIDWYNPSKHPVGLLELFNALSGRPNEELAAQVEHSEPERGSNPLASKARLRPQDDAPQHAKPPRREIEVWLPPAHFAQMPTLTLSPASRVAWLNGTPIQEAPHVLHVLESRAVMSNPGPAVARQDISALRKDSKLWWEERAMECDGGEGPQ